MRKMDITEIQDELLRLEYPKLLPDHDPDIERYFYLRSTGQSRNALDIYKNRIVVRYPDDTFRTYLLRAYRNHEPAFRGLLAKGYRMLGARSLERMKLTILVIAKLAESYNENDVYSTIKAAEEILKLLSPERYEPMSGMDRILRYAKVLDLKVKSITRAADLIGAYVTDSLSVVKKERRRRNEAQRQAEEDIRKALVKADWDSYNYQKKYGASSSLIELNSVVFSEADLARIEIPSFTRTEDQVLGYCVKYWNSVNDPAFERILFLYSQKYGKKNYEAYMAIRRGQEAKHRDDEILASVMGVLISGYYYTIHGDLYLQRNWNKIKRAVISQGQQKTLSPPEAKQGKAKAKPIKKQKDKEQKKKDRPEIARKPVMEPGTGIRSAAAGAEPAGKSGLVPAKPITVPKKPKPAEQTKTAIAARPSVQPARPIATKPVVSPVRSPAQPTPRPLQAVAAKPVVARPAAQPVPRPVQAVVAKPVAQPAPRPVQPVAAKPPAQPTRPIATKPVVPPVRPSAQPVAAKPAVQPVKPAPKPVQPAAAKPSVQTTGYGSAPYGFSPSPPPGAPKGASDRPRPTVFTSKTLVKAKGSVSDRLKELSGRSYDVYEDRFLAKARSSIRKVLGSGKGLFFSLPEEAEDLVYNFLRDHYSDPYMDWENSADRKTLLTLGFDLPSIHPVIDECYRTL